MPVPHVAVTLNIHEGISRLTVFENWVLRGMFGDKRDGVTAEWRKLHNVELNDLYCSTNIVRVIKSRRMTCTVNVAFKGER
jgi:hypothetical protein